MYYSGKKEKRHTVKTRLWLTIAGLSFIKQIIIKRNQKDPYEIIRQFINGSMDYQYDEISQIENDLLVSIGGFTESESTNYYYWKGNSDILKGVELLLEYFDKVLKVNSL